MSGEREKEREGVGALGVELGRRTDRQKLQQERQVSE